MGDAGPEPGRGVLAWSAWGTGAFVATALGGVVAPGALGTLALVAAATLFLAGCATFLVAYARVVARSRVEAIGVANVYLLTGDTAPPRVRRRLLGALGVQVVVALAAAVARPYTAAAAGTLAPVYGLGLCGLWASRHGRFPPRRRTDADA